MKKIFVMIMMLLGFSAYAVEARNVVVNKEFCDGTYRVSVSKTDKYSDIELKNINKPYHYVIFGDLQGCLRVYNEIQSSKDAEDLMAYIKRNETDYFCTVEDGDVTTIIFCEPDKIEPADDLHPDFVLDTSEYDINVDNKIDQIVNKVFDKVMQALNEE